MSVTLATLLPDQPLPAAVAACLLSGLALDSRRVQPGDGFIAVPGENVDGRKFIDAAIHAGASVVLSDAAHESVSELAGVPVIGVPQLRYRVGEVAGLFFGEPARTMQCVAVTGTNGKSSTTWFLRDALEALGQRCGLVGTLGMQFEANTIETGHTTPDALTLHAGLAQFRDQGAQVFALEASSHALEQSRLVGVPVSVAVFTNLSRDHLDYHGDMERYFSAKRRLFERPELQLAVVNTADERGRKLAEHLAEKVRVISFAGEQTDVTATQFVATEQGMTFVLIFPTGRAVTCAVPLFGRFNLENLLAVCAVLYGMNYSAEEISEALAHVTPVAGRMQRIVNELGEGSDKGPCVLVDYAHTPDGLEKALAATRDHFSGQLWCVMGCGGDRDAGKRPQMAAIAERLADKLMFTSDNPRFEEPQSILADMLRGVMDPDAVMVQVDRPAAIEWVISHAANDDVVLIAGKGHENWQEIAGEKIPMADDQLAARSLAMRGGQ